MLTQSHQERLAADILRASFESLTLKDFGVQGMPLIERLFDTSNSLLYRCNKDRDLVQMGGTMEEAHFRYTEHYYASDPMQSLMRRANPWILHGPRYPEWKKFLKLPVYTDHARHYGIDNYIHVRLNKAPHNEPGMAGMILARTTHQPDFSDHHGLVLTRMVPALEALVRRGERVEKRQATHSIVETMLEMDPTPKIALDSRGKLLWASERAEALLGLCQGGRRILPDVLVKAARALGSLTGRDPISSDPSSSVCIPGKKGVPVHAELRLARTRSGEPFVLAELEQPHVSPRLTETAVRFQLTGAETEVLSLISAGLSDREIGQRLFISMPTVRTHVGRILAKLGVSSRLQAALLAHGLRSEIDPDGKILR